MGTDGDIDSGRGHRSTQACTWRSPVGSTRDRPRVITRRPSSSSTGTRGRPAPSPCTRSNSPRSGQYGWRIISTLPPNSSLRRGVRFPRLPSSGSQRVRAVATGPGRPRVDTFGMHSSHTRGLYSCLMPYRSNLVIADFDEVTRDFGSVIRRVNGLGSGPASGSSFTRGERRRVLRTDSRATLSLVDAPRLRVGVVTLADMRSAHGSKEVAGHLHPAESELWIPSADRHRIKAELRGRWQADRASMLRDRAEHVYRTFVTTVSSTDRRSLA